MLIINSSKQSRLSFLWRTYVNDLPFDPCTNWNRTRIVFPTWAVTGSHRVTFCWPQPALQHLLGWASCDQSSCHNIHCKVFAIRLLSRWHMQPCVLLSLVCLVRQSFMSSASYESGFLSSGSDIRRSSFCLGCLNFCWAAWGWFLCTHLRKREPSCLHSLVRDHWDLQSCLDITLLFLFGIWASVLLCYQRFRDQQLWFARSLRLGPGYSWCRLKIC